jgi:hypothetical protein
MEPAEGRRIDKLGGLFLESEKAISHIWLGACLAESGGATSSGESLEGTSAESVLEFNLHDMLEDSPYEIIWPE